MNLKQRLAQIAKTSPDARTLSDVVPHQMSRSEKMARRESALRLDMKNRGSIDAEVDAYLDKLHAKYAIAA